MVKIQKILDGSAEGRIKNASERAALVVSLTAFCACPPADAAMQELAEETAEFLANYFKYVACLQSCFMHTVLHFSMFMLPVQLCLHGEGVLHSH